MCLKMMSEFNLFLAMHIQKYRNLGQGKTSYLSSTICHEFVNLITSKVCKIILEEIRQRKYYSIIVDSTTESATQTNNH